MRDGGLFRACHFSPTSTVSHRESSSLSCNHCQSQIVCHCLGLTARCMTKRDPLLPQGKGVAGRAPSWAATGLRRMLEPMLVQYHKESNIRFSYGGKTFSMAEGTAMVTWHGLALTCLPNVKKSLNHHHHSPKIHNMGFKEDQLGLKIGCFLSVLRDQLGGSISPSLPTNSDDEVRLKNYPMARAHRPDCHALRLSCRVLLQSPFRQVGDRRSVRLLKEYEGWDFPSI